MNILLISGHGANDCGAVGYGVEREETRRVTNRLAELLRPYMNVIMYPQNRNAYDDVYNGCFQVSLANIDYVFEVHFNSSDNPTARGTEIWVTPMENGTSVEQHIVNKLASVGFTNRGVKSEYFAVITHCKNRGVSSALVETCFISNKADMDKYNTNFNSVCSAMAKGIVEGFGMSYKESVQNATKSKYEYKRAIKSKAKKYETTKRTLQGEIVKSSEELMIANFLFAHGVAYEYERLYPYETNDQYRKQYRPDFYLKDYDIYLEHFGINKDGKCPQLSTSEEHKYLEDMEWKHEIHKRNNTKLIETFSWYQKDGILLEKLAEILSESGVKLQQPDYVDIYKNVYNDATDECFKSFINLCSTFINLFKAKGLKKDDLDEILAVPVFGLSNSFMRTRQALFKDIITNILDSYEKFLKKQKKIKKNPEYGTNHT